MKKFVATICCLALIAALCGGALADLSDIQAPSLGDLLVSHRVVLADEGDTYKEYFTVFYAEGSHVIKQFNDETHFDKSAGYTLDYLKSQDISKYYPGFYGMDFADCLISDEGSYYSMVVRFKKLDYLANQDKLVQNDILTENGHFIYDADYLIEIMESAGMRELSMTEYGGLGLNFSVE